MRNTLTASDRGSSTVAEQGSLRSQLTTDLTSNLPVSIAATVLALVALYGLVALGESSTSGIFLAFAIAVLVPETYETQWPVDYSTGVEVAWTCVAACLTTVVFLVSYRLTSGVISAVFAAGLAFLVTAVLQNALARVYARASGNA